ncbi:MAG: DUF6364 family protein [Bryobacteraceae bacterium]|nr:DUF6364 family protein [Bryobacteraceae bacterium]
METRNITLSLPVALIKKAKVLAAQRDTSVSALVRESLEQVVSSGIYEETDKQTYEEAMADLLAAMRKGFPLDVARNKVSRDELHER